MYAAAKTFPSVCAFLCKGAMCTILRKYDRACRFKICPNLAVLVAVFPEFQVVTNEASEYQKCGDP